ncbi:hypothetical protein PUNSTDRAFT_45540 [Punctularia strigosozonata HHB-11173 SS5]|uniref:uncharacterized protein n=1 Tax=Punctularia strigosozonata (strain HHB-11173) TaxID=741275 RepID=UPI0004417715|nr:uncharacterized protein PUNSTDRAFT_45540 [Punctularia strigosozonata HHB-11173 SS5]EIN06998.1 hypothetical protein PUNSTDRAFT_45540 [Punctularia strigosozonata HHB-11173 SS5]
MDTHEGEGPPCAPRRDALGGQYNVVSGRADYMHETAMDTYEGEGPPCAPRRDALGGQYNVASGRADYMHETAMDTHEGEGPPCAPRRDALGGQYNVASGRADYMHATSSPGIMPVQQPPCLCRGYIILGAGLNDRQLACCGVEDGIEVGGSDTQSVGEQMRHTVETSRLKADEREAS